MSTGLEKTAGVKKPVNPYIKPACANRHMNGIYPNKANH